METQKETKLNAYELDYNLLRTFEDINLKQELEENESKISVNYISISPDEKYVVCGYNTGHITIFDYKTSEVIKSFSAHKNEVIHIEWHKQNNLMLTSGADGKIFIFDINSFTLKQIIKKPKLSNLEHLKKINFVLISKNAEHIYFGSNNGCLYKCDKKFNYHPQVWVSPKDIYPSEEYIITSGVFSPDDKYIVFTSGYSVKFVNIETGKVEKVFDKTTAYINDVTFYPKNEKIIATWSQKGMITYWNIETQRRLIDFKAGQFTPCHIVFSNDGKYLVSGAILSYINVWDAVSKHHLVRIKGKPSMDDNQSGHTEHVETFQFTKENYLLSGSLDGTAKLWKLTIKK